MSREVNDLSEQTDAAGADDLANALGGGSADFVTDEDADKQSSKTSLLVFGALVLALGGYYFTYVRGGPASAEAAVDTQAAAADQTINQFLSAGDQNIRLMEQMLKSTERVVEQFKSYPSATQIPISDLSSNPFKHQVAVSGPGAEESAAAAAARKRDAERQAVLKSVQGLQLQSIMHSGTRRACMINNALYSEGQEVDGFTVEKINPGSIHVRKGAYRFELKMQR